MFVLGPGGRGVSVHACRKPIRRFVRPQDATSRPSQRSAPGAGNASTNRGAANLEVHATSPLGAPGLEPRRLLDLLVFFHAAVAELDDPVGVQGDVGFVGDQNNGVPLLMEQVEQGHDFVSGGGVEIAGGLVGQQD